MRLISLELNNIKSYKQEVINFSTGINCILGLNGSGKSTIIESVGSVLFNYNQRTNNNILRYNETKGSIALTFQGNDNIIYKIIKIIRNKGNGNVKILNVEHNELLYEGVSDVYQFVKKILNVPKEKSLSKMFEEIIAVPQGTFVNAFLETPKYRKENFDKLFELDIYKKLADKVKELSDKIKKDYIYTMEKEKAELTGKLTNYESLINEQKKLEEIIKNAKEKLNSINILYNKKEQEKNKQNEQKASLDTFQKQLIELESKQNTILEKIKVNTENLEKAKEAKKIVQENEYGYNLYLKTQSQLQKNEVEYNKYLENKEKYKDNETLIKQLEEKNKSLEEINHNLKVTLGINKQHIIDKTKENEDKTKEIMKMNEELIPLKQQINNKNNDITQIKANYVYYLNKLNSFNNYLLSCKKYTNLEEKKTKILELEEKLNHISENKTKINKYEIERVKVTSDLENLRVNSKYVSDGCCPILKQQCLNIRGSSLNNEIDKMIIEKDNELANLNTNINNLNDENKLEEKYIKEKEYILLEIRNYEIENERHNNLIKEIKDTFKDEVNDINYENEQLVVTELIRKYQDLEKNYNDDEFNRLSTLHMQLNNNIYSYQNQIEINKNTIKEKENNNKELEKEIANKNKEYVNNSLHIDTLKKENEKINEYLSLHNNIKDIINENKEVLNNNNKKYELYITKKPEANNHSKYDELIQQLLQDKKIIISDIEERKKQIEILNKSFSLDLLNKLTQEITNMSNEMSSLGTEINISNERLHIINKDIDVLNKVIIKKEEIENKLLKYQKLDDQYQIIRDVFNNLPRELSKQIRKYIGIYASILYRKIANENVRIELLDDYEVTIIDCSDENKIKTLSQLSGGEQMSVAISIRLAMLKQITTIDIYFMDEPTINLDYERRMMVAEVVKDMANELEQMYVISHDDTFESITDNTIKICKEANESKLDS